LTTTTTAVARRTSTLRSYPPFGPAFTDRSELTQDDEKKDDVDLARDTRGAEAAESSIETFIARRDAQRRETEGERQAEELWRASERRHAERRREENRLAWFEYHQDQAARHCAVLEVLIGQPSRGSGGEV
jgi:hypothetical protein